MEIITQTLAETGVTIDAENAHIIRRVIHTTADFDYARNLTFTPGASDGGGEAFTDGIVVTDTNMALAGINKKALAAHRAKAFCYMAEPFIEQRANEQGCTRAVASMDYAIETHPDAVFVIGNAPTALLRLADYIEQGVRPAFVIGVPVGFVNVEESKERALALCSRYGVPAIVSRGRKGGSNVAAAICNALLYGRRPA